MARGITSADEAQRFLGPTLDHLHAPTLMLGMEKAVERLAAAVANKEKVLIYGDYDVDGTTAVVILKTALHLCGAEAELAEFHVPHRIREGYGMRDEVIERAAAEGVRLVISVDTGIRAFAAAEAAARAGVDLIVTDHHLPETGEAVPRALAVLNPNQAGCAYPCKEICGAAVAFKLAMALIERLRGRAEHDRLLLSFLKMVAIATVADAVPLRGENRVIAKLGLDALRRPVNGGLKVLMELAGIDVRARALTAQDVAFRIAPRLNAAGRMDVAADVVELFLSRDPGRVAEIAAKLNQLNAERQKEEFRIVEELRQRLEMDETLRDRYCHVLHGQGWHRGVIGIVATRVVERTGRPTLVVAVDGEEAHGSGRSISCFHLLEALESCRHLFTRFGGHAHAVGFAMPSARVAELCAAMDAYARTRLAPEDLARVLQVDDELPLGEADAALLEELRSLEPFGSGNPEPVFVARGVSLKLPPRILKEKHVKLRVAQNGSASFDALGWRMAERLQEEPLFGGDTLDIAFRLDENTNPDFGRNLQLTLADFRKAAAATGAGAQ